MMMMMRRMMMKMKKRRSSIWTKKMMSNLMSPKRKTKIHDNIIFRIYAFEYLNGEKMVK